MASRRASAPASTSSPLEFDTALNRLIAKARRQEAYNEVIDAIERERSKERARARTPKQRELVRARHEQRLLRYAKGPICFGRRGSKSCHLSYGQQSSWHYLMELRSVPLTEFLVKYLRWPVANVRHNAAKMLAWTALDHNLRQLVRIARGEDAGLIQHIATGAAKAVEFRHASKSFRARLFNALAPVATGKRRYKPIPDLSGALSDVPLSLASLDKRRAKSLLTSPECLAPKNPAVLGVLRYLTREDPIDPKAQPPVANSEYLWPLYHSIARRRAAVSKKNMLNAQGLALQALARAYPKKAKAEAHAILRKKTSTALALANDARKVLRLCANTPEPMNAYLQLIDNPGAFPNAAADVLQAYELAQHTLRDGLQAYFDNMGECVVQAQRGLQRLGLHDESTVVSRARAVFWKRRQPRANLRDAASAALTEADIAKVNSINETIDKVVSNIERAVENFMMEHPKAFVARRK